MQKMVKMINCAIAWLSIVVINGCTFSRDHIFEERENVHSIETISELDSIVQKWNLYPERWNINGDTLWIVNTRDSLFLSGYDIKNDSLFCYWGHIGNGPDDYVAPGIIEGVVNGLKLYGNTECKVIGYRFGNGMPFEFLRGKLPVWNKDRGIPKPYTRISAINDSIGIGTYFFPRKVGADVINIKSGELLSEITLGVEQSEERLSEPYQFKIASASNIIVVAYRYLNRIEVYRVNDGYETEPFYAIGNSSDQSELYEADRDDEMVKYYSDVQCDDRYIYLLWHGAEERELDLSPTHLLVYDITTGENIKNILLDRCFTKLLTDGNGRIILWTPLAENNIYYLGFTE